MIIWKNLISKRAGGRSVPAMLTWAVIMTLAFSILPRTIDAQVLYGSLTGAVTDQTGAIIGAVRVEAVNVDTGISRIATTDGRGVYVLSNLQVGTYRVTLTVASFRAQVHENVRVDANTLRRLDAELRVGALAETVAVTAPAQALRTDRSDVSFTQTARQINDLPLTGIDGRNYQSLMSTIPGAVSQGELPSRTRNLQRAISFNFNGVSRLQNNIKIDGSSAVSLWLSNNAAYVTPAEGIQEVNIVTNSMDAEQGLAGGAVINVITKSGTKDLHGAAWSYVTNSATQARNYFQPTPQVPKGIAAQFGYALGGPILRNKLFFFTDLERSTNRGTSLFNIVSVAPASLRPDANGNVVFPTAASGGATIYDPASNANPAQRTPFPNNTVPSNRIDVAALELIKRLPQPTGTGFANNFVSNGATQFNRTHVDTKIDYSPGGRLTFFGRYSISPSKIIDPPLLGEAGGVALNGGLPGEVRGRTQVSGLGGTYAFSPTLLLDANAGFTREHLGAEDYDIDSNFGLDVLKIPGTNGSDHLHGGIPSFVITNFASLGNGSATSPFSYRDNQYALAANLSWVKGANSFRYGLDYLNQQLNHFDPGPPGIVRGSFTFNGNSTRLQNGPAPADVRFNSWADFLLGLPSAAGKLDKDIVPNAVYTQSYALYARDHWQVSRHLSVDAGVRWERFPFPDKDNTGINRFDPTTGNVLTGGLDGVPRNTGAKSGPGQFLPRVGLAYRLGEKTVVRAGYGQSADPRSFKEFRSFYYPGYFNSWTMPQRTFNGVTNSFIPVTTLREGLINTSGTPAATEFTQGIVKLPSNVSTMTYPADPQRKYIQSWNLTLERELPWRLIGQVGYVATRAVGQMGAININAGAPGTGNAGRALAGLGLTGDIFSIQPYQTATYDGLQAELTRRWASSLFGAAYTFSKAINFADDGASPRIQYYPEAQRNRGPAGYDRRHNLRMYGVWDLPFGKGQHWASEGAARRLLGGFQLNGIVAVTSGAPISVFQGTVGNLNAMGSGQYPDQIKPEVEILGGIGPGNRYFDTSAYAPVNIPVGQAQRFGNAGRNNLYGPGYFNVDLGLFRTFSLTERIGLQVRTEALNALNHPNFANPGGDISNAGTFGFVTSTVGQGSRILRFAVRVSF